ncbi:HAD family hydrolase [Kitasatospora cineracea]|uniref:HAD family hydrolase n=1 Tax=Kitasatospora cineracea TaxID=88074 RepID=UPI0037A6F6BE
MNVIGPRTAPPSGAPAGLPRPACSLGCSEPLRLAVLDLDGTLLDGFLARHAAEALAAVPGRDPGPARAALEFLARYEARTITHDECAEGFYRCYGRAVAGLAAERLAALEASAWSTARHALFEHAKPLVALLHRRGLHTWLLSGSPGHAVAAAGRELGVHHASGAVVEVRDGLATGRVAGRPAARGGKSKLLDETAAAVAVDWEHSFAIGDSSSDAEVLHRVGAGIAFEPDPALAEAARAHGWTTADRHGLLAVCRALLEAPAKAPDPAP